MSSPTVPQNSEQSSPVAPQPATNPGRSMTASAYWVQLLYVPWLVAMFVLAYGVMGLLGVSESVESTSQGGARLGPHHGLRGGGSAPQLARRMAGCTRS